MAVPRRSMDDKGNMAVEFALVLPFFLMLLMGLIDYSLAAREKSTLEAAARAGLQSVLADDSDTAGAKAAAEAVVNDASVEVTVATECLCPDGTEIACTDVCAVGDRREVVTVNVSRDYSLLVPWPQFDDPISLSATARVRVR